MGREVVIANLGPAGSGCEADVDGDGYPGTTIFRSAKLEHVPAAFPKSEDYQMAATKFGWRAPVHRGDRITQFGVYSNKDHASYEAMSFTGLYVDKEQVPPAATGCNQASYGSYLIDDPLGDPKVGVLNHEWDAEPDRLCGPGLGPDCETDLDPTYSAIDTDTVQIAAFLYTPGDIGTRMIPRVKQGTSLRFVNADTAMMVRHTVTSCPWPCNGSYYANYPLPDGRFDSGKLGNLDYIDGGITGDDAVPVWDTPTNLAPGTYSYYCRIHPWMRGAFEVTE
jgi:plastocyanin